MSKSLIIGLVTLTVAAGVVFVVAGKIVFQGDGQVPPAGITTGAPDTFEVPKDVQDFYDECTGKGGVITGEGGVKERLPTTEEGYTCWYENRSCWDFLTYSRERFMGGNPGCPETANLVDRAVPAPKPTIQPAPKPGPIPKPVPPPTEEVFISPSAGELIGKWSGSGVLAFNGSFYCNNYTIDWSSMVKKVNEELVSGEIFDSEGENVGTLEGRWNKTQEIWDAVITSEIFAVSNGTMDELEINGNIEIKDAWLPCPDITGQSGIFSGSKK